MKLNKKEHSGKCGIYCITNKINNKKYVGKAIDIYRRMKDHIGRLNLKSKDENIHLVNAWYKYGRDNFEYFVLEYLPLDEKLIKEREIYWIRKLEVLDKTKGYNLREDSESGLIISEQTRKRMREARYKALENPEVRSKCSHTYWKDNPDKLKEMAAVVAQSNVRYKIEQYDKNSGTLLKVWDSIIELMSTHPEYKKHNIYAACSGEKPSMYGFKWIKVKK